MYWFWCDNDSSQKVEAHFVPTRAMAVYPPPGLRVSSKNTLCDRYLWSAILQPDPWTILLLSLQHSSSGLSHFYMLCSARFSIANSRSNRARIDFCCAGVVVIRQEGDTQKISSQGIVEEQLGRQMASLHKCKGPGCLDEDYAHVRRVQEARILTEDEKSEGSVRKGSKWDTEAAGDTQSVVDKRSQIRRGEEESKGVDRENLGSQGAGMTWDALAHVCKWVWRILFNVCVSLWGVLMGFWDLAGQHEGGRKILSAAFGVTAGSLVYFGM